MEVLPVTMDLSEASLEDATNKLRYISPHISVSRFLSFDAQRLAKLKGYSWGVNPDYDDDEWSITINGQTVGSPGA